MEKLWQEIGEAAPGAFEAFVKWGNWHVGNDSVPMDIVSEDDYRPATLHDAADWLRSEGIECYAYPALHYTGIKYRPCVSYIDKNPIHWTGEWRTDHPTAYAAAVKKGFGKWQKLNKEVEV